MSLLDLLVAPGPKRILALDGGGIRGAITLGFLARIEALLRERHRCPDLALADYFDLIGGTSTGSIIAAGLALGMPVEALRQLYLDAGGQAFGDRLPFYQRLRAEYDAAPLERLLQQRLGAATMGGPEVRTGLCVVTKRADTNSTWPLHNYPRGRYYAANKDIPLWHAVSARTAAPSYFLPEVIAIPDRQGRSKRMAFVDGGVSMACNPALQLFLLSTMQAYAFHWEPGQNKILLVSVGTGFWERRDDPDAVAAGALWDWGRRVPDMFMDDASWQAQLLLQWWSNSPTPWMIDRELGDVLGGRELLSYVRYDVRIEPDYLRRMGLGGLAGKAATLHEMNDAELRDAFDRIGQTGAAATVVDDTGREIQYAVTPAHLPAPLRPLTMSAVTTPPTPQGSHEASAGAGTEAPVATNAALTATWRKYRGWAARARTRRSDVDRWRFIVLGLTVAGAFLATLASQLPAWFGTDGRVGIAARVLSALSAAAMALAAYSGRWLLDPATERQWLRARALGENCKSECYRYASRVPPYDGADAGPKLLDKLQQLLASGADVPAMEAADADAVEGLPPYPLSVQTYVATRIRDQVNGFYRPKATENERNAALCTCWGQGLNAVAAVLGAVGAIWGGSHVEAWVAVAGTITAAIGSYALGGRFQRLAATYRLTADRLDVRRALWEVTTVTRPDPPADRALVIDAETIMAAENKAWLAEFLKFPIAPAQAGGK